jgi:four helix bundle protein
MSMKFVKAVCGLTHQFPKSEQFALALQLHRSAISIPSNIAEGQARSRTGDYSRFISIARGSLAETQTQLYLALELGFGTHELVNPLIDSSDCIARMLRGLEQSLRRKASR